MQKLPFNLNEPIIFDTETIGLYGKTRLIQLLQGDKYVLIDTYETPVNEAKDALKDAWLVGHNIHYDLSCPDLQGWQPRRMSDTMALARISYPYFDSHSLASLSQKIDLGGRKGREATSDWSTPVLSRAQLNYARTDCELTQALWRLVNHNEANKTYIFDMQDLHLALIYQNHGMPIDTQEVARRLINIAQHETSFTFNPLSPAQVARHFGLPNANKETLASLNTPEARAVIEARSAMKLKSYLESLAPYESAKAYFHPYLAKTGRFVCNGDEFERVNLQQIPRALKSVFKAPEGYCFVTADYPALELYLSALIFNERRMIEGLESGDLHSETARRVFDAREVSQEQRQVAKTLNFSLLYGSGAQNLAERLTALGYAKQAKHARKLREAWLASYPTIAEKQKAEFKYFANNSFKLIESPLGRVMCARKATEALNFAIQSAGAECIKLAIRNLACDHLAQIACVVHDSIALVVPTDCASDCARELTNAMGDAFLEVTEHRGLTPKITAYIGEQYQ